ncbi:YjjG family noncanonical pyrimidine nucleotidase [Mangrovimonas sp. AS39]|uniref:YjjG family noncanonical pyrimidine nucleotidase n=1 Tax=Mangrovimonas futianensis TaxID=2895523 RepID=UPI001E616B36|nr:YjjG family noncanonical pyrimidine nucleotidase [Mangrovimonas futianensis]MCF1190664.1 YjjG family noncanonical pyrimidine nucleotidase [Mangrovimonas futianensis]MCF1194361.1 YjjG family noncanonical pyrimidine nucleotidase [Mangrovimonas futianensis]
MRINGITDIFFDLDHTLWDFDRNSALTFEKIFNLNKVSVDLEEFLFHYEPINLDYWKLYREDKVDKATLRYRRLSDSFDRLDYKVSDDLINKLSIDYIAYLGTFNHLFEETLDILDYLYPNYRLHIITNGFSEVQYNKIKNSKIDHYFKTITDSEKVGVKKPHPNIFEFALDLAEASKDSSIMIGDNLEADVLGALNFGLDAICFNIKNENVGAEVKQIRNLLQLKNYL